MQQMLHREGSIAPVWSWQSRKSVQCMFACCHMCHNVLLQWSCELCW